MDATARDPPGDRSRPFLVMARGRLIPVVGRLVLKDDVQADVECQVVDWALEFLRPGAAGEEHRAWVAGEVLPARGDQLLASRVRSVFQREEDIVRQQGL